MDVSLPFRRWAHFCAIFQITEDENGGGGATGTAKVYLNGEPGETSKARIKNFSPKSEGLTKVYYYTTVLGWLVVGIGCLSGC